MNLKRFETFVIVACIGVIGFAFALTQKPAQAPTITQDQQSQNEEVSSLSESVQQVPTTNVAYDGVEGQTALATLKASHRVETKDYGSLGEMVLAIDGLEADNTTNFWGFYVNGQQSMTGASSYVAKSGDKFEWKLETIDPL